jgi:hypothetical protein
MSADAEARRLNVIGLVTTACITVICLAVWLNPFRGRSADHFDITLTVPYVGQGVATGAPLMMHGVKIGKVTSVSNLSNGNVRLGVDLQSRPTANLTDTLEVDFRPANYFGVTAINVKPGQGGRPLRDGTHIDTVPKGDFTLQTLLYRLGEITGGVVTPQLVSVIKRATQYTDALNPLIETVLIAADSVTKVQTVGTEQLLRNTAGISVAFPSFVDAATAAGYGFNQESGFVIFNVSGQYVPPGPDSGISPGQRQTGEYWQLRTHATLDVLSNSFFGAVGKLLSSHPGDLLPAVGLIKTITDTVPGLVAPEGIAQTLVELRRRLEKLYGGSPEQRALQVHIVLDNLPGVQAPINAIGGP